MAVRCHPNVKRTSPSVLLATSEAFCQDWLKFTYLFPANASKKVVGLIPDQGSSEESLLVLSVLVQWTLEPDRRFYWLVQGERTTLPWFSEPWLQSKKETEGEIVQHLGKCCFFHDHLIEVFFIWTREKATRLGKRDVRFQVDRCEVTEEKWLVFCRGGIRFADIYEAFVKFIISP